MNFAKTDINSEEQKKRLIDAFINNIYVYDDKFVLIFNYKDGEKCIDFDELSKVTKKRTPTNKYELIYLPRAFGIIKYY